jgi:hypothetical protein
VGLVLVGGCKARPDVPTSCSSAVCVGSEVEFTMASAVPRVGEAGHLVLVEEGEHGTALVGLVGQEDDRRFLGLVMVPIEALSEPEIVVPVGSELRFGQALLWSVDGGRRTPLAAGEVRFSLKGPSHQLEATLTGEAPAFRTAVHGRYQLECKVPSSVLNVQLRGVNAPGSETYTGDVGLDSDFCRKFRAMQ